MIFPLIFIGAGTAALLAAILTSESDVEPAPPVPLPDGPDTPVIPSASPQIDANEIEALARVIASESGSGSRAEQVGIAWTVRNRFKGKSIYDGEYPWRAQKGSSPPFSSARAPSEIHRALAKEILGKPQNADPTGGATSFFEPRMQDIFFKAGELAREGKTGDAIIDGVKLTDITRFKFYKKNAQQIRNSWGKGSTLYAVGGRFEFWGSAPLFAARGGTVKTVVGGMGADPMRAYKDIPDPLALLPKFRRRRRG